MPIVVKKPRQVFRWLLTLIGALIVGALGNGLWEYVVRDFFSWIGRKSLELLSWVWGGYLDSVYLSLGRHYGDSLTVAPFLLASIILVFGPVFAATWMYFDARRITRRVERLQKGPAQLKETIDELERLERRLEGNVKRLTVIAKYVLPPLTAMLFAMNFVNVAEAMYQRNVAAWLNRTTEILAPKLTASDYLQLRADIRSINNTASFTSVSTRIRELAKQRDVTLPDFTPVGTK